MRVSLCVFFCSLLACAQTKLVAVGEIGNANLPAQHIGSDDLISVSVYDSPELTRTIRVGASGNIDLPMLKNPVHAAGLLPNELEKHIAAALKNEQILVDPVVTVTVVEYRSRPISVTGAVRKSITFQAYGGVTLREAITRADGLTPEAGPDILITRPPESGTGSRLMARVSVRALIEASDPSANIPLAGGEEISVPEAGRVYIAGNVRKPGVFPLKDASGVTILKLVALAEGLAPYYGKEAYIYRKEGGGNSKNEIPVALQKIIDRKAPDVPLQPDDIVYIADAKGRRITAAALEKIVGFGASTASGVLIWGH
jgi:polysaccharide export outer membrane protein